MVRDLVLRKPATSPAIGTSLETRPLPVLGQGIRRASDRIPPQHPGSAETDPASGKSAQLRGLSRIVQPPRRLASVSRDLVSRKWSGVSRPRTDSRPRRLPQSSGGVERAWAKASAPTIAEAQDKAPTGTARPDSSRVVVHRVSQPDRLSGEMALRMPSVGATPEQAKASTRPPPSAETLRTQTAYDTSRTRPAGHHAEAVPKPDASEPQQDIHSIEESGPEDLHVPKTSRSMSGFPSADLRVGPTRQALGARVFRGVAESSPLSAFVRRSLRMADRTRALVFRRTTGTSSPDASTLARPGDQPSPQRTPYGGGGATPFPIGIAARSRGPETRASLSPATRVRRSVNDRNTLIPVGSDGSSPEVGSDGPPVPRPVPKKSVPGAEGDVGLSDPAHVQDARVRDLAAEGSARAGRPEMPLRRRVDSSAPFDDAGPEHDPSGQGAADLRAPILREPVLRHDGAPSRGRRPDGVVRPRAAPPLVVRRRVALSSGLRPERRLSADRLAESHRSMTSVVPGPKVGPEGEDRLRRQPEHAGKGDMAGDLLSVLESVQPASGPRASPLPLARRASAIAAEVSARPAREPVGAAVAAARTPTFYPSGRMVRREVARERSRPGRHPDLIQRRPEREILNRKAETVRPADLPGEQSAPARQSKASRETAREFNSQEIEFLASKVYPYVKRRLGVERERHGRPGYALWR